MNEQTRPQNLSETILQVMQEKKPETVSQLAHLVGEKNPVSEQEILDKIIQMQNDGKLQLTWQLPHGPPSLAAYLRTSDSAWYLTTLVLTIASMATIFMIPANLHPYVFVRYVLGLIFILWLPGYTLTKALFPRTRPPKTAASLTRTVQNLDIIERIALSIGLSLALVPMMGLLLYYTPWGINLTPVVFSLAALTLTFATVAVLREKPQSKVQAAPKD